MAREMNPFWMVYGIGQSAPTRQHASQRSAQDEATRLARLNPGKTFVVLEALAAVRKRDVGVTQIGHGLSRVFDIDDDIPF